MPGGRKYAAGGRKYAAGSRKYAVNSRRSPSRTIVLWNFPNSRDLRQKPAMSWNYDCHETVTCQGLEFKVAVGGKQ